MHVRPGSLRRRRCRLCLHVDIAAKKRYLGLPWPVMRLEMRTVYSKNPNFVFRKVAREFLLIPVRKKLNQVNKLYVLNETAAAIWDRIDGRSSMEDIVDGVTRDFEVSAEQLSQDASTLIQDLLSIEAIEASGSEGRQPGREPRSNP